MFDSVMMANIFALNNFANQNNGLQVRNQNIITCQFVYSIFQNFIFFFLKPLTNTFCFYILL